MIQARITQKMVDFYQGNLSDIEHFLKVHAYAALIGQLERLDEHTQNTLEIAAIVHDIACPLCRKKYGSAKGSLQEKESEDLLRPFLAEFSLSGDLVERVIYLVSHHHTVTGVDGDDYRILLEADFLVNASEGHLSKEQIQAFYDEVVRTTAGKALFKSVYQLP